MAIDRKVDYGFSDEPKSLAPTSTSVIEDPIIKTPKKNKYALGCAILASMTSILLGYGTQISSLFIIPIHPCIHISFHYTHTNLNSIFRPSYTLITCNTAVKQPTLLKS